MFMFGHFFIRQIGNLKPTIIFIWPKHSIPGGGGGGSLTVVCISSGDFSELSESVRAHTEDLENKQNEIDQLEKSFNFAKAELVKKEQARKELAHKVRHRVRITCNVVPSLENMRTLFAKK